MKSNKKIGLWTIFASLVFAFGALARPISGTGMLHLNTPVNKEISDKTYDIASKNFIIDCIEWLKEESETTVDTANAVWRYHLSSFAGECLRSAKSESSFKGHEFSVTMNLSSEEASVTLKQYNRRCQSLSLQTWTQLKKLLENNTTDGVFQVGIQAIFYSMGRLEKTLDVPGAEEPGSFLVADARNIMQSFIDKITIRCPSVIITGKPGSLLEEPLQFQVFRDSTPIPDFDLLGTIPGKKLFSDKTSSRGTLTVTRLKVPFVHRGTFLYVMPDFSAAVNYACSFTASDLGLKFPEQTLLFNTILPTFSVSAAATAASALQIPKDFGSNAYVAKYLCDSCFLKPAGAGEKADLNFKVSSQVVSYSSDSTELTTYKVENAVTITDAAGNALAEKTAVVLEKSYETNTNYSLPLFYWEAAGKSFAMIKAMLRDL
ncbi:MAG TPA: hypothetical protein VF335_00240 [Chitinivibrionales bacterium]